MIKCPHCGSTAQFKEYGKEEGNSTLIQIYKCGCGYIHQVFWEKTTEVGYMNGKRIDKEEPPFENI